MKNKIICASIESLRQEGLKFSVDALAEKLRISKKTIYKFFPDKEALALALYEKYYADASERAKLLIDQNAASAPLELLHLYFDAKTMTRSEIFNKYKVNEMVYSHTEKLNDALWEIIFAPFAKRNSTGDLKTIRIIIDGSFEKLCNARLNPDAVIERLVQLL